VLLSLAGIYLFSSIAFCGTDMDSKWRSGAGWYGALGSGEKGIVVFTTCIDQQIVFIRVQAF